MVPLFWSIRMLWQVMMTTNSQPICWNLGSRKKNSTLFFIISNKKEPEFIQIEPDIKKFPLWVKMLSANFCGQRKRIRWPPCSQFKFVVHWRSNCFRVIQNDPGGWVIWPTCFFRFQKKSLSFPNWTLQENLKTSFNSFQSHDSSLIIVQKVGSKFCES